MVSVIVAFDSCRGIGKDNALPWHLPEDLKRFKKITTTKLKSDDSQNVVIMGRRTWESLPENRRPLPNRTNVVVTRNSSYSVPAGVRVISSLEHVWAESLNWNFDQMFVIGGGTIYRQAIESNVVTKIFATEIQNDYGCDTVFPDLDHQVFTLTAAPDEYETDGLRYRFLQYSRSLSFDPSDQQNSQVFGSTNSFANVITNSHFYPVQ